MMIYPRIPEETVKRYELLYNSGIIVWHEPGRHGTIHGIKKAHLNEIHAMLIYYLGSKCAWRKDNPDNTVDLEFCHMTKDYPPPKRPWHWCGTTILFKDWQEREETNYEILSNFHLGDDVTFTYRGVKYQGVVANLRKRATVIVKGRGKFYVPASDLEKV